MRLILTALEPRLSDAWQKYCGDLDFIQVHRGSILDLEVDAVVSPANSFGLMDGGIDLLYSQHFGWKLQDRLQEVIRERQSGELLVGNAEIVATDDARIPYLIAAPTMRLPAVLNVDTVNPYLAARAVLLLISRDRLSDGPLRGEPISTLVQSVAFPGLGTGVGQVPPEVCARQVRVAIDEVLLGLLQPSRSWADVTASQLRLLTDHRWNR